LQQVHTRSSWRTPVDGHHQVRVPAGVALMQHAVQCWISWQFCSMQCSVGSVGVTKLCLHECTAAVQHPCVVEKVPGLCMHLAGLYAQVRGAIHPPVALNPLATLCLDRFRVWLCGC
jgi:hypothetical protein